MVDRTSHYGLPRVGLTVDEVLALTTEDRADEDDDADHEVSDDDAATDPSDQ